MTYTKVYYEGTVYSGKAIQEASHFEFMKVYSLEESRDKLIQAVEDAARQQNKTLLKIDIDYSPGIVYHIFDATYYYYDRNVQPQAIPLPLIYAVVAIIGMIVATYALKETKEIIYGPEYAKDNFNPMPYAIAGVIVLVGYFLLKESKLIPNLRESLKEI